MADPMTTPPLDLTALRAIQHSPTSSPWAEIEHADFGALLDRVEESDGLLARLSASGGRNIDLLARAEAAERDLAAVTVSRDGWQPRAEAAEKKVAAGLALADTYDRHDGHRSVHRFNVAHSIRTALDNHTPETETTP